MCRKPLVPLPMSGCTCSKAPSLLAMSRFTCRKSPSLLGLSHLHGSNTPFLHFTHAAAPPRNTRTLRAPLFCISRTLPPRPWNTRTLRAPLFCISRTSPSPPWNTRTLRAPLFCISRTLPPRPWNTRTLRHPFFAFHARRRRPETHQLPAPSSHCRNPQASESPPSRQIFHRAVRSFGASFSGFPQ